LHPNHDASLSITEELKNHLQYQDSSLFVVEQLLGVRVVHGQIQVLIKWMGFDEAENTWEAVTTILEDAPDLLRDFLEVSSSGLASQVRLKLSKGLRFWGDVHPALTCWALALRTQSLKSINCALKLALYSIPQE
jgi:hypothetical protein